jgi:hypothetical protein
VGTTGETAVCVFIVFVERERNDVDADICGTPGELGDSWIARRMILRPWFDFAQILPQGNLSIHSVTLALCVKSNTAKKTTPGFLYIVCAC